MDAALLTLRHHFPGEATAMPQDGACAACRFLGTAQPRVSSLAGEPPDQPPGSELAVADADTPQGQRVMWWLIWHRVRRQQATAILCARSDETMLGLLLPCVPQPRRASLLLDRDEVLLLLRRSAPLANAPLRFHAGAEGHFQCRPGELGVRLLTRRSAVGQLPASTLLLRASPTGSGVEASPLGVWSTREHG